MAETTLSAEAMRRYVAQQVLDTNNVNNMEIGMCYLIVTGQLDPITEDELADCVKVADGNIIVEGS